MKWFFSFSINGKIMIKLYDGFKSILVEKEKLIAVRYHQLMCHCLFFKCKKRHFIFSSLIQKNMSVVVRVTELWWNPTHIINYSCGVRWKGLKHIDSDMSIHVNSWFYFIKPNKSIWKSRNGRWNSAENACSTLCFVL